MVPYFVGMVRGEKGIIRLQKRYAYTYNDTDHFKYVVTIPEEIVSELGWKEKQELEPKVEDNKLVFKEHSQPKRH
jgi:hypothetical protein